MSNRAPSLPANFSSEALPFYRRNKFTNLIVTPQLSQPYFQEIPVMIQMFSLLRALMACALLIFILQSGALAQQTAKTKAARIDEVMSLANKYRLFNGAVS